MMSPMAAPTACTGLTLESTEVLDLKVASPYKEVGKRLLDFDINLVGVIRDGAVHVQFHDLQLAQSDVLVYISSSRLDWPTLRANLDQ